MKELLFGAARRGLRRPGGDRQERVESGIMALDAAKKKFRQLDGRNFTFCQQRGKFFDRRKGQRFFVLHG